MSNLGTLAGQIEYGHTLVAYRTEVLPVTSTRLQ